MSKTMSGHRAKIFVDNQLVGLYDSVSYGENIGMEPVFILGRTSAAEIVELSYEAIQVDCSGFRIIGEGVHRLPRFPKLQDILGLGEITLAVTDRESGETVATIIGCKPMRNGQGHNAKQTSRIQVSYMGLILSDEDGDSQEAAGAADLPE